MKWFKKLKSNESTIYNYKDSLGSKIVTPTLVDPVDIRTKLNNIQKVIHTYLSPHINQRLTSGHSNVFLKFIH